MTSAKTFADKKNLLTTKICLLNLLTKRRSADNKNLLPKTISADKKLLLTQTCLRKARLLAMEKS